MIEVLLPALPGGAATLLRWLVDAGARVERGTPLALVLTARAELLLPAPAAGTLAAPVAPGTLVEPGGLLARLSQERPEAAAAPAAASQPRATPLARSIARAHGLELAAVAGTGPRGQVRAADVRSVMAPSSAPLPSNAVGATHPDTHVETPQWGVSTPTRDEPRPLRFAPGSPGGAHETRPHAAVATATVAFDAGPALARVAALGPAFARLRLPLGLGACVLEAATALLPEHEQLNARWAEEAILLRRRLHVALAEPGPGGGLRWALVCDAGDLTLRGVARAVSGPPGELSAATFAIVALRGGATWQSAGPPLPGTAACLSLGAVAVQAVAVGESIATRPVATLTLSYDARVADHRQAAAFLAALRARLERPADSMYRND